jgi:hypothetical protein
VHIWHVEDGKATEVWLTSQDPDAFDAFWAAGLQADQSSTNESLPSVADQARHTVMFPAVPRHERPTRVLRAR